MIGLLSQSSNPLPVSKLDRRHTGGLRKRDTLLTGEEGRGWVWRRMIRTQESLVLYKSLNTLWVSPCHKNKKINHFILLPLALSSPPFPYQVMTKPLSVTQREERLRDRGMRVGLLVCVCWMKGERGMVMAWCRCQRQQKVCFSLLIIGPWIPSKPDFISIVTIVVVVFLVQKIATVSHVQFCIKRKSYTGGFYRITCSAMYFALVNDCRSLPSREE
jgi:hypothetical protein